MCAALTSTCAAIHFAKVTVSFTGPTKAGLYTIGDELVQKRQLTQTRCRTKRRRRMKSTLRGARLDDCDNYQ